MKIAFKPVLTVEVEVPRLSSRKRRQAGHELLFLCESDPGARQVRIFSPAYQRVTHQASPRAGWAQTLLTHGRLRSITGSETAVSRCDVGP